MPVFDELEQEKKLETIRRQEEEELARVLSDKYGLQYVDLTQESINSDALRLVPETDAREANSAAFSLVGKRLSIAVHSPNNEHVHDLIETLTERGYEPKLYMASMASLKRAWGMYSEISFAVETKAGAIDISNEEIARLLSSIQSLEDAQREVTEVLSMKKLNMTSRILEVIMAGGLATHASDVHIEPEEEYVRLRYRLHGVLTDVTTFDHKIYRLIISRIKLLSGLKINVQNAPQDGRFTVGIDTNDVEIRTSILPGAYGESAVLRILDPNAIAGELETLGIEPNLFAALMKEIKKPNGLIINTGPTGSGKTTTLYAFLRRIHHPDIKIITIEDPVEYHLPGIVQTQVDGDRYTFASGLRSTLRQDPDVIMVGEIRDHEVAETAIHAALTGHLVFSTLHTNNAAGALPRLIDIGIDRDILGSAINVVMAQRLVRVINPEAKREVKLEGERKEYVDKVLASVTNRELIPENTEYEFQPIPDAGEEYTGRKGVFEAVVMTEEVEHTVKEGGGIRELEAAGRGQGYLSMKQDGVIKALKGMTTLDEVMRVLGSTIDD